jgi:hypothetical protein
MVSPSDYLQEKAHMAATTKDEMMSELRAEVRQTVRDWILTMPVGTQFTVDELTYYIYNPKGFSARALEIGETPSRALPKSVILEPLHREGLIAIKPDDTRRSSRNRPVTTWERKALPKATMPDPHVPAALWELASRHREEYLQIVDMIQTPANSEVASLAFWSEQRARLAMEKVSKVESDYKAARELAEAAIKEASQFRRSATLDAMTEALNHVVEDFEVAYLDRNVEVVPLPPEPPLEEELEDSYSDGYDDFVQSNIANLRMA